MRRISFGQKGFILTVILLLAGALATYAFEEFNLDIKLASQFHDPLQKANQWPVGSESPWICLYDYGAIPGVVLMIFSFLAYASAILGKFPERLKGPLMVVFLTCLIGPGILVNGILKPYWGRPRPSEIQQFNGPWKYHAPWQPGIPGKGKSFTCGHCSFAFASTSVLAFYPYYPYAATTLGAAGFGYGIMMSHARIAQGGHFVTDALWSGIIIFSLLSLLYYNVIRVPQMALFFNHKARAPGQLSLTVKLILFVIFFIIPSIFWLFFHPYFEVRTTRLAFRPGTNQAVLEKGHGVNEINRRYTSEFDYPVVRYEMSGLGFPWSEVQDKIKIRTLGNAMILNVSTIESGINANLHTKVTLTLPVK